MYTLLKIIITSALFRLNSMENFTLNYNIYFKDTNLFIHKNCHSIQYQLLKEFDF
jgi:hypothetical protein